MRMSRRQRSNEPNQSTPSDDTIESISQEHLLSDLTTIVTTDHIPSPTEYENKGRYTAEQIIDHFGTWHRAISAIGDHHPLSGDFHTREQMLNDLRQLTPDDEPPTITTAAEHCTYPLDAFQDHFGSWTNTLHAAGYDVPQPGKRISKHTLLNEIHRLAESEDPPTAKTMRKNGCYSVATYEQRFGSWNTAVQAAGFDTNDPPGNM